MDSFFSTSDFHHSATLRAVESVCIDEKIQVLQIQNFALDANLIITTPSILKILLGCFVILIYGMCNVV